MMQMDWKKELESETSQRRTMAAVKTIALTFYHQEA